MATASTILTTTAASTAVVGMREELGDIVSVMDPAETPLHVLARHRLDAEHDHARVADHHPAQRARSPTAEGNVASNSTPKTTTRRHKNVCEIIQNSSASPSRRRLLTSLAAPAACPSRRCTRRRAEVRP